MPNYVDALGDAVRRLSQAVGNADTPVVPAPSRWFIQPNRNPGPQRMIEQVLATTGLPREHFSSGAFIDPRTGEVLDGQSFASGAMFVNPETGRPAFGVSDKMDEYSPAAGAMVDANLIRRLLFKPLQPATDLPFLTAVESGKQHHYAIGARYESPVLLRNTLTGPNPTLRPRSRGSVWGNEQVGEIDIRGKTHPVYSEILIAPRGQPRAGKLLRYVVPGAIAAGGATVLGGLSGDTHADEEQY